MEKSFRLEILTPNREFFNGEVESLIINTPTGQMGILYDAMRFVSLISKGQIQLKIKQKWINAILGDGFIKFINNDAQIFVDKCRWPYESEETIEESEHQIMERERQLKKLREFRLAKVELAKQLSKLKVTKD